MKQTEKQASAIKIRLNKSRYIDMIGPKAIYFSLKQTRNAVLVHKSIS